MGTEFEKLQKIIADVLNLDAEEVTAESNFADDLGADSLDLFEIMNGITEEFDVTIDQEAAEKVTTVAEAFDLIKGALGDKA